MKHIAICLFFRNLYTDSVELWLQTRREAGPLDGFLEFPGGKLETGESPRQACLREVVEEVGMSEQEQAGFKQTQLFFRFYTYQYPDRKVKLYVFLSPEQLNNHAQAGSWQKLNFLSKSLPISEKILPANGQIIDDVLDFLADFKKLNNPDDAWRLLSQSQNFF